LNLPEIGEFLLGTSPKLIITQSFTCGKEFGDYLLW
jgi:hypothetical protein